MTEESKKKAQETRQEHRSKREAKEREKAQELSLMRKRLIQVIDNQNVSDAEALQAVALLWSISEKTRYY